METLSIRAKHLSCLALISNSNTVKTIDADSSDTNSQIISEWVWNLGDTHKLVVSCKKHDGTVINRFVDLKSQA